MDLTLTHHGQALPPYGQRTTEVEYFYNGPVLVAPGRVAHTVKVSAEVGVGGGCTEAGIESAGTIPLSESDR